MVQIKDLKKTNLMHFNSCWNVYSLETVSVTGGDILDIIA